MSEIQIHLDPREILKILDTCMPVKKVACVGAPWWEIHTADGRQVECPSEILNGQKIMGPYGYKTRKEAWAAIDTLKQRAQLKIEQGNELGVQGGGHG